jgi:predicted TIM-barrel fold metal-dependent hydrolase
MIIDGYSHCGRSKFLPVEDLLAVMNHAGIHRAMLCQHLGEYDNSYLESIVRKYPDRFRATCLVDTSAPTAVKDLRRWHATGCFHGLRGMPDTVEQHFDLCVEAISRGMNFVFYAPDGIASKVQVIRRLAQTSSRGRIVISHLGNPKVQGDRLVSGDELLHLASEPNIDVQLSGFSMFCAYPYLPLHGFIKDVIAVFDADRVLWGSNFPVSGGQEEYQRDLQFVHSNELGLKEGQIDRIVGKTAEKVWFKKGELD